MSTLRDRWESQLRPLSANRGADVKVNNGINNTGSLASWNCTVVHCKVLELQALFAIAILFYCSYFLRINSS